MARQLDILALEPFHGGARRAMLEAVARCSRHRWTILKLPPRRMERRLLVSATWFAEVLSRRSHPGRVDAVFASEALNLADFFRLRPDLAKRPSVVYFHENQLPDADASGPESPTDLVNLNSASAATEIWFNSLFNLRTFLSRASGMVARHPELQTRNPMPGLAAKAHLVPPPIDLTAIHDAGLGQGAPAGVRRDGRSILVDARDVSAELLASVVHALHAREPGMRLVVIGRVPDGLPVDVHVEMVSERDGLAVTNSLAQCGVVLGLRERAPHDDLVVRSLAAGCTPVVSSSGVYPDLIPEPLHERCLHDGTAASAVDRVLEAWGLDGPTGMEFWIDEIVGQFDAIRACKVIDRRLEQLAGGPMVRVMSKLSRRPVGMA